MAVIQDKGLNDELQTSNDEMKSLNANLTQKTNQLEKENYRLKVIERNLTTEIDELKQQQGKWKYA